MSTLFIAAAAIDGPHFSGIILPDEKVLADSLRQTQQFEKDYLDGNHASSLNVSRTLQSCNQACPSWCWATCATMAASAFSSIGDCTSTEEKAVQHEISPSCDRSCPGGSCNTGGTGPQIADAIAYLSGVGDYQYTNGALSASALDESLQYGPVSLLVNCASYGGHGILISGGSGGNYVGHDPEGYSINVPYSGLTTYIPSFLPQARCSWFGTTFIPAVVQKEIEDPYFKGLILPNEEILSASMERTQQFEKEYREGNYISQLNVSRTLQQCNQACSSWCWATCAAMSASAFGSIGDCTSSEEKAVEHEISPSCDRSCPGGSCNTGGTGAQIADAISYLSGVGDYDYTNSALAQQELDESLQYGPVTVLVNCASYGGHGILISGVSGGNYVGHDPEGYSINVPYSGLTTYIPSFLPQARCSWFGTTFIPGARVVV